MEDHAYLYPTEKLGTAVYALVGDGDVRDRLYQACKSIMPLSPRQLPEHLRDEYSALKESLTWLPVEEPGEGSLRATLRVMDNDEADRLAKKFFELYIQLVDISYRAR